ncbi:MAG: hypothetical protein JJU22_07370 [Gammaproteobacteria bacterium]|nr:hypothetical protein [Gammaproteobacteria bacterium]
MPAPRWRLRASLSNQTAAFSDMKKFQPGFAERQQESSKAKQALLNKAKEASKDPNAAARHEARREIAIAREARQAERKAERRAEKERKALAQAEAEAARLAAEQAEQERLAAEAAAAEAAKKELLAAQKAERDRRYAARKARR